MKNARKLFTASIMLLVAFFAVVTATYAWFTVQTTPEIGNINFGVTEGEGVYFSLDPDELGWSNNLTGDEIYDYLGLYSEVNSKRTYKYTFKPVSPSATENGFIATFHKLQLELKPEFGQNQYQLADVTSEIPSSAATKSQYLENTTTTAAGYLAFNLYFKSVKPVDLYLYGAKVYTDLSVEDETVRSINAAAAKMARIGFVPEVDDETTAKQRVLRIFNPSTYSISSDASSRSAIGGGAFYAKANVEKLFRDMINKKENNFLKLNNPEQDEYYTFGDHPSVVNMSSAIQNSYNMNLLRGTFTVDGDSHVDSQTNEHGQPIISIPAWNGENIDANGTNYVYVTIYLWLEGWDNNSVDAAQNGEFQLDFKFIGIKQN